MARKPIEMMKLKQIIRLKERKTSNREISGILSVHRNTVNKYVRLITASGVSLSALREMVDAELAKLFPETDTVDDDRYEVLSSYFSYFAKELKKTGCTKFILWKWYISKHPDGCGTSQFNEHLNSWSRRTKTSGKINHRYGDKVFVDYTGKKLRTVDRTTGEIKYVEVFAAILPASHYVYVQPATVEHGKHQPVLQVFWVHQQLPHLPFTEHQGKVLLPFDLWKPDALPIHPQHLVDGAEPKDGMFKNVLRRGIV
ncbi:hypothetical protein RQM65_14145 [Pricia sp. S334]|uniref:Transposase n=1 Tax=Pricia mediterranea TaxID=3076079 RepID=A0ABU3L7T6_9FLAO|nr:hypothetical protein [Pricia sp. S334]MDT7829811.1 hypothetical protein [Pricia sp. S334]